MTRVLLIDPGKVGESWYEERQCPSLGPAYIGTYLKANGIDIRIIDMSAYKISSQQLPQHIDEFHPDIVGFSSASFNILDAYEAAEVIKKTNKSIFTVLGGAHASAMPEHCLKECPSLDAIVIGEGEMAMQKLCKNPEPGIHREPFITILDDLPFPEWSLYDYSKYIKAYSLSYQKEETIFPIVTARGCPYTCKFCYPLHGKRTRYRSPQNVFEEIERNYHLYGARFFYIVDSSFTLSRRRVQELCKLLIDSDVRISFKCQSRIDLVDKETLDLLKKAGCELIFFGIESGVEEILDRCMKGTSLDKIRSTVQLARKAGVHVRGSFIIGLEGDTRETIDKTIKFARELKDYGLEQAQFHCLDLYPKTEFWNMVERGEGTLRRPYDKHNWTVFSRQKPSIIPDGLSLEEMEQLREYAQAYFSDKN